MTPEDRRAQYQGLRLRANVDRYGTIRLEWAFEKVFGVVAPGSTTSSVSLTDNRPVVMFRAALSDGNREVVLSLG